MGVFGIIGSMALFLFADGYHRQLSVKIFYGRYSYEELGMSAADGILIRLVCYGISFLLIYLFMMALPEKEKILFVSGGKDDGGVHISRRNL